MTSPGHRCVSAYLGTSPSVFQNTSTGRPTSRRAFANNSNNSSTDERSFSSIDVSDVAAYTTISSSDGKISRVSWLLSLIIGVPEDVVASGSTSSPEGGGMTGSCRSISATCNSRPWCNRRTFTLRNTLKNSRLGTRPTGDDSQKRNTSSRVASITESALPGSDR
ncbi:hypothetical protein BJV77DRAFT_1023179, partial [Russula vinacea]